MAIIAAGGGTDLYCHSEPPLTSGKLCFIINFIGGPQGEAKFLLGGRGPPSPPLNRPCCRSLQTSKTQKVHKNILSGCGL